MTNRDAIANLKTTLLTVQTLAEIHALIVNSTYEEIEQAYNQLPPQQQTKLKAICDQDTQIQLSACSSVNLSSQR